MALASPRHHQLRTHVHTGQLPRTATRQRQISILRELQERQTRKRQTQTRYRRVVRDVELTERRRVRQPWDHRSWAYSKGWRRLLERMRPIAEIRGASARWRAFHASFARLAASTRASYWVAVCAARTLLGRALRPEDRRHMKVLTGSARAEERLHAPPPMRLRHYKRIWRIARRQMESARERPNFALQIALAYVLAQRVSDVAQLAVTNVRKRRFRASRHRRARRVLTITVRAGKVVPLIGAYTLFLCESSPLARMLWSYRQARQQKGQKFLFVESRSRRARTENSDAIRLAVKSASQRLQARSIRRGGLQALAEAGVPLEKIREGFSKHRSVAMLTSYLEAGASSLADASSQIRLLNQTHGGSAGAPWF